MNARFALTRREFIAGSAAALGLAAGAGPAWAADEATLLAAARKEGPLMLYSPQDPAAVQTLINGYKNKYKLEADFARLTSSQLGQRFVSEQQVNQQVVDVVAFSEPPLLDEGVKHGWFADISDLPSVKPYPKEAILANGRGAICADIFSVVAWNTNQWPKGIARSEDFLVPELKGRILLSDPRAVMQQMGWYVMLMDKHGDEFVRKLGQQATFSPSSVPGMQQIAAGAAAVYSPVSRSIANGIKAAGAPVNFGFVDPVLSNHTIGTVVSRSRNPNAARLFLNFWMSVEGQTINSRSGLFAVLPNTPEALPGPQGPVPPEVTQERMKRETAKILGLLGLSA